MNTGTPASTPGAPGAPGPRRYFQRPGPRAPRGRGYAKLTTTGLMAAIMIAVVAGAIENGESSSGTQEDPPAETPVVLLTASFGNMPATHNGSAFTFDLTFSENVKAGYARIRDHAFTVSGASTIASAVRKTQGSNQNWTITVQPEGNGAISITLPPTTDCDDDGAICTQGGKKLSNRNELAVSGPS